MQTKKQTCNVKVESKKTDKQNFGEQIALYF